MNSLPPFAANTNESDHPALESIAAYLDGRLPDPERRAMTAHLDSCAACYEIYSESLRFQKEESVDARRGVLTFERRKSWIPPNLLRNLALPLAALLLIGVGAAVWRQLHLPLEAREVASLTASLTSPEELTGELVEFDRPRGPGDEQTVRHWAVAFQSGATLVDLKVAIEANDPERIRDLAQYLGALFAHIPLPPPPDEENVQAAVNRFLEDPPPPNVRDLRLADFRSLESILRTNTNDVETAPHFELGKWTEAGRLAAYGARPAFFADLKNRKSLRWFRRHPPKEEVKAALAQIEDSWPKKGSAPSNLGPKFDDVIDPYDVSLTEE